MLPCLRRVLRPAFSLTAGRGLSRAGHRSSEPSAVVSGSPGRLASQPPLSALVQRCYLGTHPLKEPVEPLNSPRGAKDFIYSLHPSERSCLLRELHKFESIAIAQVQTASGDCECVCEFTHSVVVTEVEEYSAGSSFGFIPLNNLSLYLTLPTELIVCSFKVCRINLDLILESLIPYTGQLEIAPPTSAQLRYNLRQTGDLSRVNPASRPELLLHNAIPFVGFGFLDNCIMIVAGTQIELSIGVVLGISTMAAAALGNLVSDLAGLGLAGYVEALASRLGMQIPELSPKQADMWQTRVSCHTGKAIGVGIGCILGMFPLLFFSDDDEKKEGQTETKDKIPPAPAGSSKN
ncbi:hypothetical protein CCH79_00007490 [Gambusia affinis]|uniref:Transmembrane protein 65 n=1 Tax=Gambusia affinis TaxID=33528 RepID=A0A315WDA5_GAMAF|nr:hypothetical protein CCH79_00007490 [Gambusia affinis]